MWRQPSGSGRRGPNEDPCPRAATTTKPWPVDGVRGLALVTEDCFPPNPDNADRASGVTPGEATRPSGTHARRRQPTRFLFAAQNNSKPSDSRLVWCLVLRRPLPARQAALIVNSRDSVTAVRPPRDSRHAIDPSLPPSADCDSIYSLTSASRFAPVHETLTIQRATVHTPGHHHPVATRRPRLRSCERQPVAAMKGLSMNKMLGSIRKKTGGGGLLTPKPPLARWLPTPVTPTGHHESHLCSGR